MKKYAALIEDFKYFIFTLVVMILLVMLFRTFFTPEVVVGDSMENSLHEGDYLLSSKVSYEFHAPKYNDIVSFDADIISGHDLYIKRVIGLPGDHIQIRGKTLYRNGKMVKEPYIKETMDSPSIDIVIPKRKVFVMGDNRNHSMDSRDFGPIDYRKEIRGKVLLRFKPFNQSWH